MAIFLSIIYMGSLSAQKIPLYWWKAAGETARISITGSLSLEKEYTLVTVYQTQSSRSEQLVWRLGFGDSLSNSLTTQRVLTGGHAFRYDSLPRPLPVIATVQQNCSPGPANLTLGDSVEARELMCFGRRLGVGQLRRVQSYLAVRHGITLGPVDYVDGRGQKVWHYREDSAYHHRIFGLARDSAYGLTHYEAQSCEESLLTLMCDSLPEGAYLLTGTDGNGTWRVRATRAAGLPFILRVATPDSLLLSWETDTGFPRVLPPFRSDSQARYFALAAPDSVAHLTFLPVTTSKGVPTQESDPTHIAPHTSHITVYPNPASGHVSVQSEGASIQSIQLYDTKGHLVLSATPHSQRATLNVKSLPSGCYYLVATTPEQAETHKLIVR